MINDPGGPRWLPMLCRPGRRALRHGRLDAVHHRSGPLGGSAARWRARRAQGGAPRRADQLGGPQDRARSAGADHLEVLDAGRYFAPLCHTRNCRCASLSAVFSSSSPLRTRVPATTGAASAQSDSPGQRPITRSSCCAPSARPASRTWRPPPPAPHRAAPTTPPAASAQGVLFAGLDISISLHQTQPRLEHETSTRNTTTRQT